MHYDNTHVVWNYNMPLWFFILTLGLYVLWVASVIAIGPVIAVGARGLAWITGIIIVAAPLIYTIGGVLWDGWL